MSRVPTSAVVVIGLMVACATGLTGQGQRGAPPTGLATGFLAGQVVDYPAGRPVPQATVFLQTSSGPPAGRGRQPPVFADSQGRFFFAELPAGPYSLLVTKPGYMSAAGVNILSRPIELRDGERILDLKL